MPKKSLWYRVGREFRMNWGLYLLVILPLAFLIIFKYIPIYGVQIAFRDFKIQHGITGSKFVGLKHFKKFLTNYKFFEIMRNTVLLSLYSLATFPLPIIFALLLNYIPNKRFQKSVQLITYAPHFITTVIIVGMVIQFLDARTGVINRLLGVIGIPAQNYMGNPDAFPHIFVFSNVWQNIGYNAIMYIAALSSVSPELHEAAIIDGATIPQRIRHVDLPGILPTVSIMLIMRLGSVLNVGYEKIYLMQNSLNLSVSEVISTYVYKQGLQSMIPQYSYSTAVNLFVSVVNVIMLILANRITKKMSGSGLF